MISRLSSAGLPRGRGALRLPRYDRAKIGAKQVHLGVGAFFKAHQAVYTDDAIAAAGGDWRIVGVSFRRPDMRDALDPQEYLFTVVAADGAREERRVVGALKDMIVAPEDPQAVVGALADPAVSIVTLTITEKGYCLSPATGALDFDHADIAADIASPERPTSAIGYLVAAFARRAEAGAPFPTVISCDNLPENGARLRSAVIALAERIDPRLAERIASEGAFPSTMVDRIVPATTPADLDRFADETGLFDAALVRTEPFSQWVIEDRFAGPRPPWEKGGALIVADVKPFELAKLRLLNGAHSTIAYLGYLARFEHVADVMARPEFARFIARLQEEEIAPVTPAPESMPLRPYMAALRARFANPTLRHRTFQIAMDGSQKLPQRLLNTVRDQLSCDGPIARLALGVAAWTQYVSGVDEQGRAIDVRDPLADRLRAASREGGEAPEARAAAFLSVGEVFDRDLALSARFSAALTTAIASLRSHGAVRAVAEMSE